MFFFWSQGFFVNDEERVTAHSSSMFIFHASGCQTQFSSYRILIQFQSDPVGVNVYDVGGVSINVEMGFVADVDAELMISGQN